MKRTDFPTNFGIMLYNDGGFTYYAGMFSSYVGYGNRSLDGDALILTENADPGGNSKTFRFRFGKDELDYIAECPDSFMYVKVSDGEKFTKEEFFEFPF